MLASILGRDLPARLARDVRALGDPPAPGAILAEDEIDDLPSSVQRYLRFMGAVGHPAVTSFRAHLRLRFRTRPGQQFMAAQAWQYNRVDPIARLFWMRIDMAGGLLPMVGRDSYLQGHGRMLGKLFDRIVVADGRGEPFDIGELTTWLNDAVMMAPSMLLQAPVIFEAADDTGFDVVLTDTGRTVRARVVLDERGAPVDFRTEDRYADLPGGPVRTPWSTPTGGWRKVDGRGIATRGSAVWHLPEGDFTYGMLEFAPGSIELNPDRDELVQPPRRLRAGRLETLRGASEIAAAVVAAPLLHDRYDRWGATEQECRATMPGDDLVPEPVLVSTRAITIQAPPEAVWAWLAQIGHGRGGLYSYDGLENLVGLDIHSADRVLPEHQQPAIGDVIRLGRPGSPAFRIEAVDPPRSLVLLGVDPATLQAPGTPVTVGTGATWQWTLQPVAEGSATRVVSRQRNVHPRSQRMLWRTVQPVGFVMERRMLLGIKERAETAHPSGEVPPGGVQP